VVRLPRGWRGAYHPPQAGRATPVRDWQPGYRGTGMRPIRRPPVQAYGRLLAGVPLQGGQAQGVVPASGAITLQVGPHGLGVAWYPASAVLSTTTGPLDTSTALVYLGTGGVPTQLVGTVYSGNGTVSLPLPVMTPGQQLIVSWSGAHSGDVAAVNITGTTDALTTG
jgi:hypothetical protein